MRKIVENDSDTIITIDEVNFSLDGIIAYKAGGEVYIFKFNDESEEWGFISIDHASTDEMYLHSDLNESLKLALVDNELFFFDNYFEFGRWLTYVKSEES